MVLFFFALLNINFHPQIIASLFAMRIFFVFSIMSIVGFKPANPGIAVIAKSDFKLNFFVSKLLIIIVLEFLKVFFVFKKVFLSEIKNILVYIFLFVCK